jgi:hypothetical protein
MAKTKKARSGPYLNYAVLCEHAIQEAGTNVQSLIKIIDVVDVTSESERPIGSLRFVLAVGFKSGDFRGRKTIRLTGKYPGGVAFAEVEREVEFTGGNHGPVLIVNIAFAISEAGLHWFDVFLDRALVTRVPLNVKYTQRQPSQQRAESSLRTKRREKKGQQK